MAVTFASQQITNAKDTAIYAKKKALSNILRYSTGTYQPKML